MYIQAVLVKLRGWWEQRHDLWDSGEQEPCSSSGASASITCALSPTKVEKFVAGQAGSSPCCSLALLPDSTREQPYVKVGPAGQEVSEG